MSGLRLGRRAISILGLAASLAILAMGGCASTGGMKPWSGGAAERPSTEKGWWYASFLIDWPPDEDLSLDADLLIAHRIVSPVLDQYKKDIFLWRFHRRAARDEAGHRFSFIFYTTAATAREIYAAIKSSAVLGQLKSEGVILAVSLDDTNVIARPGVEATSDRKLVSCPSGRRGRILLWASAKPGLT